MSVCAGVVIRGKQNATVGGMGQTGLTALARLHFLIYKFVSLGYLGLRSVGFRAFRPDKGTNSSESNPVSQV